MHVHTGEKLLISPVYVYQYLYKFTSHDRECIAFNSNNNIWIFIQVNIAMAGNSSL